MSLQTLNNIQSGLILLMSLMGISFGVYGLMNGFYLSFMSFFAGMMGFLLFVWSIQPPFGYSCWDEYENPYSYKRNKNPFDGVL